MLKGSNISGTIYKHNYYNTYEVGVEGNFRLGYFETATFLDVAAGSVVNRVYLLVVPKMSYLMTASFER